MEKIKEVIKWILGVLSILAGIIIYKKINDSNEIENANIKIDAKEEILTKEESKVDTEIDKKEKELETIRKSRSEDLTDEEIKKYWNNHLKN